MIYIAICIDKNFIMQASVLITSILKTNKTKIKIFIISNNIDLDSKKSLETLVQNSIISLEFINIDLNKIENFPIGNKNHLTNATYYRLLLPFLLPDYVNKILYLDCDMIVVDDLSNLYNTDITHTNCGCVIDMFNNDTNINKRLNYSLDAGYFNAGLILINLDEWKKNNISDKALNFIDTYPEKCLAHDQDALNYALNGNYINLSCRYNMQLDFFCDFSNLIVNNYFYSDIIDSRKNPCIIHFTGPTKPWFKNCNHPYTILWNYFQSKTNWKHLKKTYEYSGIKLIKYFIKKILIKFKLFKEKKSFIESSYSDAENLLIKIKGL